jgi:hypothetical protein
MFKEELDGMKISIPLKVDTYEVSFGYSSKLGRYTVLMLDIPKLDEMPKLMIRGIKYEQ